jgi:hypothetical protein
MSKKPIEEPPTGPVGPLQARILKVLAYRESTAAEITETLNAEEGAKVTTLASVRDTLYRRMVKKGLVEKLPVAFALVNPPGKGKKK